VYSIENNIVDSFSNYKKSRNHKEVEQSLLAIREIASFEGALLPAMKVSLLAGATIGEICNELKNAWDEVKS
jgi:methylmalonyl-CoA mutase N-terminal domain/subunit